MKSKTGQKRQLDRQIDELDKPEKKVIPAYKQIEKRKNKEFKMAEAMIEPERLKHRVENNYTILTAEEVLNRKNNTLQPPSEYSKFAVLDKNGRLVGWFYNKEAIQRTLEGLEIRKFIPASKKANGISSRPPKKVVVFGGLNTTK